MNHVVLLGDSIFDNGAYVGSDPAVVDQLDAKLGADWQTTLLALDGDMIDDVAEQLRGLPNSASHLVVSVGGNDALNQVGIFSTHVETVGEALLTISKVQRDFRTRYEHMLTEVLKCGLPTAVCTIYDPNFGDGPEQQMSVTALSVFNDQITRLAFQRGMPVIDLRSLFRRPAHYANPIEPSSFGGGLIVEVIAEIVTTHDFNAHVSSVWSGKTD